VSVASAVTISNGLLVLPEGKPRKGAIRLENGRIAAVGETAQQRHDVPIDAKGALIAPGLVDFGVFAIDKPAFHFGGITRAALMPDQGPPLDRPSTVRFAAQSGKPDFWVHPLAAATKGIEGSDLAEIALMQGAGAKAVATGRRWIGDSGVMLRLLRYCAMLDIAVVSHAEDAGLADHAVASAGEMATRLGLPSAPSEAEALAVARDIALAEIAGARLHLRQVTTAPRRGAWRSPPGSRPRISCCRTSPSPSSAPSRGYRRRCARRPTARRCARRSPTARSTSSPRATIRAGPRTSACRSPMPNPAWPAPRRCCR
jgi:dihydroorotase